MVLKGTTRPLQCGIPAPFLPRDPRTLVVGTDVSSSGGVELTYDNWHQADVRADEDVFFFMVGVHFFWKKRGKKGFPLKSGPLGGSGGTEHDYRTPLVGCTVKTNTTDIQTVDSDYSKSIHQEIPEERKTKSGHDERVEKRACEIELRGAHLKLVT